MEQRAYIVDGVVHDVLRPVAGFSFEQCFPARMLEACVDCGEDVCPGWIYDGAVLAPPKGPESMTPEEIRHQRLGEISVRLDSIDSASIRPLRAIMDNTATDADRDKLAALEQEAAELRAELAELS